MKKIIIGGILTVGIILAGSVQANHIDKNTETHLVKICKAIKSDSQYKVDRAIKESGINAKKISQDLVCNGHDPVTFAIVNNAQSTAKFMAHKSGSDYEALLAKL